MTRYSLLMAATGAPALLWVCATNQSPLVPSMLPLIIAALGVVLACGSALARFAPGIAGGAALQAAGAGLTGLTLEPWELVLAGWGVVMEVGAFTASLSMPYIRDTGRLLGLAALLAAAVAAGGLTIVLAAQRFAGGGRDAAVGIVAWLVLVLASLWMMARWASRGASHAARVRGQQ